MCPFKFVPKAVQFRCLALSLGICFHECVCNGVGVVGEKSRAESNTFVDKVECLLKMVRVAQKTEAGVGCRISKVLLEEGMPSKVMQKLAKSHCQITL